MSKFTDKIKKILRALRREIEGESNRIVVSPVMTHFPGAMPVATTVPSPENKLQFEASKVLIEGASGDVHRVRCLDNVIGTLSSSFNEKSAAKIALHVADVSDSLARIRAFKVDGETKTPVDRLEYKGVTIPLSA